jgi:long-chain acyl-CoA synthetase
VLPLHHTFEFSAGLLMPMLHGAQVTYLEEVAAEPLSRALSSGSVTGMIGVPQLWQLLQRKIEKPFSERGTLVLRAFEALVDLNRRLRERTPYGMHLGKLVFLPIHRRLGGRLRLLISGGSALSPETMKAFRGLGFKLYEGYGMTEAAPVIAVQRPGDKLLVGSVGRALPGIDVKLHEPDERGVGEVIARGPNVMIGYYQNASATDAVLREGWLHTGDLGRMDAEGNLYIVGRKKEMILGASGENVYPDELEEVYRDSPYVKELSVVGLPAENGETIAMLVVPDYQAEGLSREEIRERVREHVRQTSQRLAVYKRVKVSHLWDHDLPKTATRKVKRREVVAELERLEGVARAAQKITGTGAASGTGWAREVVASVCQRPIAQVTADARLSDLGFDSLMFTELGVALEAAGAALPDPGELSGLETVADVEALASRHRGKPRAEKKPVDKVAALDDEIRVPNPLVRAGRKGLRLGQRAIYERLLDTQVSGGAYVPPFGGYIVAANHSSHLDMGLVKHALGEQGDQLVALAAKDYFFEDPVRRMYFENFTNLVPMERHGSLRESLRLAAEVIREGYILLIFPEGTRSDTGVMTDFKPSLGYLALTSRCGILPMYLGGTHDAMPKGAFLPRPNNRVEARFGPFQSPEALATLARGATKSEQYRRIAVHVERIVRRLAPVEFEWTLGAAGRVPIGEPDAAVPPSEAASS